MEQLKLPMLTVYEGPRLVDLEVIAACKDYRSAVRACWDLRTRPHLKQETLAEECGLYASHVSDYLSTKPAKPGKRRRDLPPDAIDLVENACSNRFISQWIAYRARLPMMDAAFMAHLERMRRVA
jgi:hypothetical protein